jgi:ABC-type polysaccharide/polyol phosphate export permease
MAAESEVPASFRSSAVRPGPASLVWGGFQEFVSRRRLIRYLVQADLKKKGADTLLGNVWWIVDPLLQMLVYVVLVSVIFQRRQPDYALFVFAAILPWKWFTSSIGDGTAAVVSMERLIKQINFPKIVLPVASVFAGVANFFFGLIPLAGLMILFYPHRISIWLLAIPAIALVQLLVTLPLAIVLAALNVFYRDVGNLSRHLLRLWFYLSPAIYGVELIDNVANKVPIAGKLMELNPWAVLFTAYHDAIYETRSPNWLLLALLAAASIPLLAIAIFIFKRVEPSFAKVL